MKTIEEKARTYDEALERAKTFAKRWGCVQAIDSELALKELKEIFPELIESEDEKTRKALVEFVKSRLAGFPQCEEYIAWLEKQKTFTDEEYNQGKEDVLWCIKKAKEQAKDENEMGTAWFAEKWLEKQGEQKQKMEEQQ